MTYKPKINPPPRPSTPKEAPWDDVGILIDRVDKLTSVLESAYGLIQAPEEAGLVPGVRLSPILAFQQLVDILQSLSPQNLGPSQVIPFKKTISVATQDEQERQVSVKGAIRDVIMAFPAGCQQLLEVRLIYLPKEGDRVLVVPSVDDSFIALDDFTVLFHPYLSVDPPGKLRVEWYNYDSLNSHTVPVVVTVFPRGGT